MMGRARGFRGRWQVPLAALLAGLVSPLAAPLAQQAPAGECDRLAAHPADPNRVAPGVQWDLMDARAAIRACQAALATHPRSARLQFQLGRALIRARRRDEGLPYLFEAAGQNYVAAFAIIGGTYQYDLGNVSEALKWYRRGVALNDVSAQTHLGDMYLDGVGVERDLAKALELFRPSAEQGYPLAQYKIGVIYQQGDRRVRRDMASAVTWFRKAAENGFARAQNDLGYLYETGDGVRRNLAQAAGWYRLAAEQGWALAQVNLAALYERGAGVRKDYKMAFYWSRLASDARLDSIRDTARQSVERLKSRINPAQIAEVDRLVATWRTLSPEESADAVKISGLVPLPAPRQTLAAAGQGADPGYTPPAIAADSAYQPPGAETSLADSNYRPADGDVDSAYQPPAAPGAAGTGSQGGSLANITPAYGQYQALANVNVREAPTTEARKLGRLVEGDVVVALGKVIGADWLMVTLPGGAVGYAAAAYLKPVAGSPESAPALAAASARDQVAALVESVEFGRYHALVIGNNSYRNLPPLKTAVNDATAVANILREDYGFQVQTLLNATRADIVLALDRLRAALTFNDNLLIYYAGHGILDQYAERGYWLPVDAAPDTQVNWVSNATITDSLKAMPAKHVMLVVDSCYSGTLTRGAMAGLQSAEVYRKMVRKRVRVALTSGGLEPVIDDGGSGHSVFAKAFIETLKGNEGIMDGTELFQRVRRPVMLNAQQTPEFSDVKFAGHDGGDFIFVRRRL